jgi:hypothetical protein
MSDLRFTIFAALAFASEPTATLASAPNVELSARAIFAKHDHYGRFKWTRLTKLGDVPSGGHIYAIYNLYHVNEGTGSGHGMQQVSIIRDGRIFVGSYLDIEEPMAAIKGRTVIQKRDEYMKPRDPSYSFMIGRNGPPRKVLLGGQIVTLEKSI